MGATAMYVCMYVYMCVCMYVYMYVYMCVCMYVYMYVYMYICVYVYMYVYIHIHTEQIKLLLTLLEHNRGNIVVM